MNARISKVLSVASLVAAGVVCFLIVSVGEVGVAPAPAFPPPLASTTTVLFVLLTLIPLAYFWRARSAAESPETSKSSGTPWRFTPHCLVAALTLVGFTLRFAHLDEFGYGNDETLFLFSAGHESLGDTFRDLLRHFHPPTNFFVLHFLTKISWDPVVIRLPSVLGGTLAIGCTFLFVRSLFGTLAGLFSAFLVTFSPSLILLSQVCRNYSPSLPFLLLALYFLVRYLREWRRGLLYAFALFECLAVLWHYALLPLFLGANVVLFVMLLLGERRWEVILRAVAAQLPVAFVYAFALFYHQPRTESGRARKVVEYMVDEFNLDWLNPVAPLFALVRYLLANAPGRPWFLLALVFFLLAVAACIVLFRRGLRWRVLLCLSFLPFSYFFAFAVQMLPFGGTRHSFFAYPLIFALLTGLLAWAILGRARFMDEAASKDKESAPTHARRPPSLVAATLVTALGAFFLFGSLRLYADVVPYELRQLAAHRERQVFYRAKFYKPIEMPTRRDDLERLLETLMRHSDRGDYVLTSYFTLLILKPEIEEPPSPVFFDLNQTLQVDWKGRHFLYVPEAELGFSPRSLMTTIDTVARRYDIGDDETIWLALAGWETWNFLWWGIRDEFPETLVRVEAAQESRETLFGLNVGAARDAARRLTQAR